MNNADSYKQALFYLSVKISMTISKPPTSKKVSMEKIMKGLIKCQVGCWGLPFFVFLCIVLHVTITSAATIPTSALPQPNGPIPPPLGSQMSNIRKRNANFHQQIAMIRNNATQASSPVPLQNSQLQKNISVPMSVAAPSSAPSSSLNNASLNSTSFLNSLNANNYTLKNHSLQQSVAATSTSNRIGQVLLDSSVSFNDITVCGSEDCFDTGMQITTDSVPPPTPTMRQQIADAILMSDYRNKGRGERFFIKKQKQKKM